MIDLKIALVHDFLTARGGAERVLEVLAEMFPDAPIYTLLYDKEKMRGKFEGRDIRTSFLQKLPKFIRTRRSLILPLLPTAPETFDLRDFDLVISSSGAWTKGIVTRLNTIHVAYLHSPMRFVWDVNEEYLRDERASWKMFFARPILNYLRVWDKLAADRPDHLIANSKYTAQRIKKYYRRDSTIIYPPLLLEEDVRRSGEGASVDTPPSSVPASTSGHLLPKGEWDKRKYFLIVSRLTPNKKIDIAIEAFNKLELPLLIIGEGRQEKKLKKIAGKNVRLMGWQTDERLRKIYADARALVFPGIDDFGLTMVEAMAEGTPVVAQRGGGALEIVKEGQTGEFFNHLTPEVLADGIRRFRENEAGYDREFIKKRANEFSRGRLVKEIGELIDKIMQNANINPAKAG
jgi:glycosyltransferase involved in cell wall biosynthesis